MSKYKLLYKDEFYALYQNELTLKYTYRCPDNFDIVFCKDSSGPVILDSIDKHLRHKHMERKAIAFDSDSSWYKDIIERIESLHRIKEVIENETVYYN